MKLQQSILTTYSDIDINGHVNSIKYIEHILDLFPIEYYKKYRIKKFDIAYIMESHNNDKLNFYTNIDSINECNNTVSVRVTKSGFKEEKEVCRCQFHSVKKVLKVKINIINLSIFIWNAYMQTRNVCSQKSLSMSLL